MKDKQKILELERDNRNLKKQVSRLSSDVDSLNIKTKELSERPPTQSIIVVQAPPEEDEEQKVPMAVPEKDLGIPDEASLKMRLMNAKFTKIVCKTKKLAFTDSTATAHIRKHGGKTDTASSSWPRNGSSGKSVFYQWRSRRPWK